MLPSEPVARPLRPSRALHVKSVGRVARTLCDARIASVVLSRRRVCVGRLAASALALRASSGLNLVGGSSTPSGMLAAPSAACPTSPKTLRRQCPQAWKQAYPADALQTGEAPVRAGHAGKTVVRAGSEAESPMQRSPYFATREYRARIFSSISARGANALPGRGSPRPAGHEVLSNSQT